jgi:hypothetical protein
MVSPSAGSVLLLGTLVALAGLLLGAATVWIF